MSKQNKLNLIQSALQAAGVDKGLLRETWVEMSLGGSHEYVVIKPHGSGCTMSLRLNPKSPRDSASKVDRDFNSESEMAIALASAIDMWGLLVSGGVGATESVKVLLKNANTLELIGAEAMQELIGVEA